MFLEEPLLSAEGGTAQAAEPQGRGCPAVWLLKHQVSLAALTDSSCSTLSSPVSAPWPQAGVGVQSPELRVCSLLRLQTSIRTVTVPWTKGGQELCRHFSEEDKFPLELSRRAPTPLSQSKGCFREYKG